MENSMSSSTQGDGGAGLASFLGGPTAGQTSEVDSYDGNNEFVTAEESTVDNQSLPGEDTEVPADPTSTSEESKLASKDSEANKASVKESSANGTKETVVVTDESGKKRKLEIDYSNKEAIKQAHIMAAGMRKFQAERDRVIEQSKAKDAESVELKGNWQRLEEAYSLGKDKLFDLLEGRQGAFQEFVRAQVDRSKYLERASPEEIKALEKAEENETLKRQMAKLTADNESFKKSMSQKAEEAEIKETQAQVYPVFNKYRFAGKLGDDVTEAKIDKAIWNNAIDSLKEYETKGQQITAELIEKEFRNESLSFRKLIGQQAEKKVSKVVEQKKQEATENVQAKIMSGYSKDNNAQKAKDLIRNGDTQSIFKNWATMGKFFTNK